MGINLPVRQVVLYDIQRYDGVGFTPLSTNTVWQRVGRAGRPGLDDEGEAVLMAPTWDREVEQYRKGSFEPIESQLKEDQALAEQIVTEVASGLSRTPKQLKSNLQLYLAGQQDRLGHFDRVYDEMLSAGMIDERTAERHGKRRLYVNATRRGWIAVRHMLKPATVLLCQRVSSHFEDLSFFDLLLTAACTPDTSLVLPVDFEELDVLAERLQTEPSFLLAEENATITQLLEVDEKRLLAGIKMALAMRMWTRTGAEEQVADAFTCYPFEITRLRESMHRVLLAWPSLLDSEEEDVPAWVYDGVAPLDERIGVIRRMVNAGIDEKAATLSLVPGIGSTFASRLTAHGVRDIEDLALAEPNNLCEIRGVSKQRADDWITEACHLIGDRPASWYQDVGPETEISRSEWPNDVDPYRLRRALDLTVRKHSTSTFVVSGGLEPHRLQRTGKHTLECDCADAAKGNLCKHVLAVRLRSGDKKLRRLAQQLTEERSDRALSLFDLWYDHSKR
jgi:helicase